MLAVLVQHVELDLVAQRPVRPKAELTLRTNGPVPAIVRHRDRTGLKCVSYADEDKGADLITAGVEG